MARHTASSHGDTPILIQTLFSYLNVYASTCAQELNVYSNLVFVSSLAGSVYPVAVVVLAVAASAALVLAVASEFRAAASAAAAAVCHACCVCFFCHSQF